MSESDKKYVILRVKKLHKATLNRVHKHNYREMNVPNAKEGIENIHWTYDGSDKTILELINERLEQYPGIRVQKNSVLAMEIILTASHSFFEEKIDEEMDDKAKKKIKDKLKKKTDEWESVSKQWLMSEFGDCVLQITTHNDEKSKHMHCMIIPVKMKTKMKRQTKSEKKAGELREFYESMSLCANDIFTKESLTRMQTEYANSVEKFGLKRGVKGSDAIHVPMKILRAETAKLQLEKNNVIEQKNELEKDVVALKEEVKNQRQKIANTLQNFNAEIEVENEKIKNENEKLSVYRKKLKDVHYKHVKLQNTLKNKHEKLIVERGDFQKEKAVENEKINEAYELLSGQEKESKTFIDACFSPLLTNLDAAFSDMGPQGIKFLRDKLEEFDENLVKYQGNIPVEVSTHLNKRLNTLQPKKLSLKD